VRNKKKQDITRVGAKAKPHFFFASWGCKGREVGNGGAKIGWKESKGSRAKKKRKNIDRLTVPPIKRKKWTKSAELARNGGTMRELRRQRGL